MVPLEATNGTPARTSSRSKARSDALSPFAAMLGRLRAPKNGSAADPLVIGVIASESRCSTTSIVMQLADSSSLESETRTLIVDAIGPRSELARRLSRESIESTEGLVNILYGRTDAKECLRSELQDRISFLPWGEGNDALLRPSTTIRFSALLDTYRDDFDLVLVALPPATEATHGAALGATLDGVLLVVEAERTSITVAKRAQQILERANVRVMGAVLDNCREYLPSWLQPR